MQNWIPKKSLFVSTTVMVVVSIILYLASLSIVLLEIRKIENYYKSTESKSSIEEKIRVLNSISEVNKEQIESLRKFFIQKGDEVKFIEQIETIGRDSTVKFEISSIDVKPNQIKNFKEDVTVKMSLEGSWDNIMLFVDRLEKMQFGVSVQNLNLDTKSETGWSGSIDFILFRDK